MAKKDFDYIIIGGGPAGCTAAINLAKARKNVAIVEAQNIGGTQLIRDIPFSINQNFAHSYYQTINNPAADGQVIRYDLATLVSHQELITSSIENDILEKLHNHNITILNGFAKFIDNDTVSVGANNYTASNFIIATGANLKTTGIAGLENVNYLTPDSCVKVKRLPKCVFVTGGGSTGCEIAEYFAKLGTKVIIMERGPHLLPREDKDVSDELTRYFTEELGIMVIANAKVIALEQESYAKRVIFTTNSKQKFVRVDCIVLATGSEPNLDLGLDNTNISYKNTGIPVNKYYQTSSKHIFAIGDVLGDTNSSTELSEEQANILSSLLLRKAKTSTSIETIRRTDTDPEIATIGYNEYDLLARDRKYRKIIIKLSDLPISGINNTKYGIVKIILDTNNRIIGATIMSQNAASTISFLLPFIKNRASIGALVDYTYPSDSILSAIKSYLLSIKK